MGQAIAFAMNTQTQSDPLVGMCVTLGLLGVVVVPTLIMVNKTPDRIPADVIAEERDREAVEEKYLQGEKEEKE